MMNFRRDMEYKLEYYRGNELSASSIETPSTEQGSAAQHILSAVEGKGGEDDVMSKEREKQLELWMENVKAFIRQIDVSRL